MAVTVGIASSLLVSAIVLYFWNRYALERFVLASLEATAGVVADSLEAAVSFDDRDAVNDSLAALEAKPEVELGCVYDRRGQLIARYGTTQVPVCPVTPRRDGTFNEGRTLIVSRAIRQDGRSIGSLHLQRSRADIDAYSTEQLLFLVLVSGLGLIVGLALSNRLQRLVSEPIVRLAQMTRDVSERQDYSLRALRLTGGEIGTLVDAFNTMLERIELKNAELERAIQARDDFVSTAAHELRNPVNAVQLLLIGVLRAANRGTQPITEEWVRDRVGQTHAQVERLIRLLDNLLNASRIADHGIELELDNVDFADVVRTVVERFEEDPKNRHVTLDVTSVVGRWDKLRLEQVVTNLLSNAFKYGGGKPIVVSLTGDDETASFAVTDHGIGIDPDRRERLFERFERAAPKQRYGGFGLGLWITRSIVAAMGGNIVCDSQPNQGSTFRVELPRGCPSEEVQAPAGNIRDTHELETSA